ncbi:MAG: nitrilase-related carbon-nitrogen hydrolase, partial [Prolixibacteraceae bacterium]
MKKLKISTAQFENKSGDKKYNLSVIEEFTKKAVADGSKVMAFHECSVTGYTFARRLSKNELLEVAEFIPEGETIRKLTQIAAKYEVAILAGLFEKDREDKIYNTYV